MPDQLQLRGGTTTEHNSFTGALREVTVDTTKKTLVVHDGSQAGGTPLMRESGGNAASSVQIGSGGVNAFTIDSNQDITLTGASANVVWDKSNNALEFADNAKAIFGDSNDLSIRHDGSDSVINDNGTGNLILKTNGAGVVITTGGGNQIAEFNNAGSCILRHQTNERIATSSTGVDVTGDITGTGDLTIDTNTLHVDSSNNRVGIGTTSPEHKFNIVGSSGFTNTGATLAVDDNASLAANIGGTIALRGTDGIAQRTYGLIKGGKKNSVNNSFDGYLAFHTRANGFSTAGERMRIDSSGNVGIGTTSPSGLLHISGDTCQMHFTDEDDSSSSRIYLSGSTFAIDADHGNSKSNTVLAFRVDDLERMRIDSSGNLLLGATSYGGGGSTPILYVSGTSGRLVKIHNTNSATTSLQLTNAATGQGEDQGMQLAALANGECMIANAEAERILIQSKEGDDNKPVVNFVKPQGPSNAQTTMIAFETGNQGRGAVLSSSSDGGSPSFASSSDYRIKTNIRDYTNGYDNIKAIPVKLFDMISDGTKDIKGWIAHEVQAYIPEAVMGEKDAVDSDGKAILQNLSYGLFMPDVVGALQTAIAKIEVLETKVAALEAA